VGFDLTKLFLFCFSHGQNRDVAPPISKQKNRECLFLDAVELKGSAFLDVVKIRRMHCREAASRTPILTECISERLPGCADPFGFGPLNLFFRAAL
jgi:hypothetical protein